MDAKKIMLATDFSQCSEAALELAASLARDSGAKLIIVHVETIPYTASSGDYLFPIPEPRTGELQELLLKVLPKDRSISVEHRLLVGDPADAIVQAAELEQMDLIVIGTHGRQGISRLLMGSVAESIVRAAPCPVMIVKQPLKQAHVVEPSASSVSK